MPNKKIGTLENAENAETSDDEADVTPKPNIRLAGESEPLGEGAFMIGQNKYLMVSEEMQRKGWYSPDAETLLTTFNHTFKAYTEKGA